MEKKFLTGYDINQEVITLKNLKKNIKIIAGIAAIVLVVSKIINMMQRKIEISQTPLSDSENLDNTNSMV